MSTIFDQQSMSDDEINGVQPQAAPDFGSLMTQRQQQHGQVVNSQRNVLAARGQLLREQVAGQQFENQNARLDLDAAKFRADTAKERYQAQVETMRQTHVANAIEGAMALDHSAPDYQAKLAQVMSSNVLATSDPMFQKLVTDQFSQRTAGEELKKTTSSLYQKAGMERAQQLGVDPLFLENGQPDYTGMTRLAKANAVAPTAIQGMNVRSMTVKQPGGDVVYEGQSQPSISDKLSEKDKAKLSYKYSQLGAVEKEYEKADLTTPEGAASAVKIQSQRNQIQKEIDSIGGEQPKATTTPEPPSIPELKDKSEFDKLPSGSQYIRNGVTYQKP